MTTTQTLANPSTQPCSMRESQRSMLELTPRNGREGSLIRTLMFMRLTSSMKSSGSGRKDYAHAYALLRASGRDYIYADRYAAHFVRMRRVEGKDAEYADAYATQRAEGRSHRYAVAYALQTTALGTAEEEAHVIAEEAAAPPSPESDGLFGRMVRKLARRRSYARDEFSENEPVLMKVGNQRSSLYQISSRYDDRL